MPYPGVDDLERAMHAVAVALPHDVDLVVGIPRSGLLAASMLALHLTVRLTDVAGLPRGRRARAPARRRPRRRHPRERMARCEHACAPPQRPPDGRRRAARGSDALAR